MKIRPTWQFSSQIYFVNLAKKERKNEHKRATLVNENFLRKSKHIKTEIRQLFMLDLIYCTAEI